jgi:4-amino-4-deoxy-L-arabinose transferase-like glycosyltransferase
MERLTEHRCRGHTGWLWCSSCLFASYFLVGIFGRFPWKADEPYSFGIVWEMLTKGHWLVPHVAGEPFVEKPPLVYWLGALSAKLLPTVAAHESSRLAVVVFVALSVAALAYVAVLLHGEAKLLAERYLAGQESTDQVVAAPAFAASTCALLAVGALAGTVGFAEHIHKLLADVGQLAGAAIGLAGLVYISVKERPSDSWRGGILLGIGCGIAFLSKGPLVPGVFAVTVAFALTLPAYRNAKALRAFVVAAGLAIPVMLSWPLLLWMEDPVLFHEWIWDNNLARFLGLVNLGGYDNTVYRRLPGILSLGLPTTLAVLWLVVRFLQQPSRKSRLMASVRQPSGYLAIWLYLTAALGALLFAGRIRDVYVMPALLPMVLLALPYLLKLPGAGERWLSRLLAIAFLLSALTVWIVWAELVANGRVHLSSPLVGGLSRFLPVDFEMPLSIGSVASALVCLALWGFASRLAPIKSPLLTWCNGFALLWATTGLLWLPWIDAARSYQETFGAMRPYLATSKTCVATHYLGESERAMLNYVTGVPLVKSYLGHSAWGDVRRPNPAVQSCDLLVVEFKAKISVARIDSANWELLLIAARPAETDERFALLRRKAVGGGIESTPPSGAPGRNGS